jgi:hypothetical protein
MRPIYETQEDLASEQGVAKHLAKVWRCEMSKLPIRYHLDFVAQRGKNAVAFCEVKVRTYSMEQIGKMGGYMLSLGKWSSAKQMCEASGLPFILVVKAADGIWYAIIDSFKPDSVIVNGRQDRGDWQDIEPCVLINQSRFKKL